MSIGSFTTLSPFIMSFNAERNLGHLAIVTAVYNADLKTVISLLVDDPELATMTYRFSTFLPDTHFGRTSGSLLHLACHELAHLGPETIPDLIKIADFLVYKGNHVDTLDSSNNSSNNPPLFWALNSRNLSMVEFLLSKGANPEQMCDGVHTALSYACSHGYYEMVDVLIKHGVNVNYLVQGTASCLYMATSTEMVKALLDAGADPNIGLSPIGTPSLTCEAFALMLEKGLDINRVYKKNLGLHMLISSFPNIPVLHMLLRLANVDVTTANEHGRTAAQMIMAKIKAIQLPDAPSLEMVKSDANDEGKYYTRWEKDYISTKEAREKWETALDLCLK